MLSIIMSIYVNASSCVKLSSSTATHLFPCERGVRQGCILSPLLFNLFTADLERELRKNKSGVELCSGVPLDMLMYADDVVLISSSAAGLKKHLHTLSEFCQKWRLVVNTEKTKICVFGKDTDTQVYSWNNTILEKTQSYKYLGVWFTKNGKFTKAKKHLADQAKKAMFSLQSTIARLHHPPIPIILQLYYESMLKPIMCYGCEIWGFTDNTDLEKVELRFLKAILHLPTSAPNMAVRGKLGQLSIHMWWKERILKYWDRICSEEVPKLLKAAMYRSLEITQAGGKCWAQNVANIFNNAGYPEFFSGSSGCDKTMRNVIMCSYRDQFIQLWHATLEREHSPSGHGGNKLRSYTLFKNEIHLEPYLMNIQSIALRVAMTRLRVGCHNLEIEVGRYHKPRPLPVS